ncbi:MAG: hypothetical protein IIU90_00200, partial [Bacteroidaceae bacterium]|nr:hypothetical protein [Bacteroidaceae bacterium]
YNYIGNSFCASKACMQKTYNICNSTIQSLLYDILIFAKKNNFITQEETMRYKQCNNPPK